jgi:nitroreductase
MAIDSLLAVMRDRRSVRAFSGEDVTAAEVRTLVEAAGHAPSNHNRQAWKFLVVRNREVRARLRGAVEARVDELDRLLTDPADKAGLKDYRRYLTFFAEAPVLVVALYRKSPAVLESILGKLEAAPPEWALSAEGFSVAMAVQNLLLAAHALGLAACCTTGPLIAADKIREILRVGPGYLVAALVPVGRPAGPTPAQPRKTVDKILEVVP